METSAALGFGFRCGFLGLLHLEVIRDRLEREYDLDLITTAPSVIYKVHKTDGSVVELHNPADMPDPVRIDHIEEPRIKATILVPDEYLGDVLKLCQDRRGVQLDLTYAGSRAMVVYDLPLNEVVFDFYDRLKSVTKGYASFDYAVTGYQEDDLVKMQILVNDEPVDALSTMVHRARADARGRAMVEKLKELIPQHLFKIPIQAAIGGRIIARETISALRKDVTAKCYGGDMTRKRKLLDKQKAGKKKMRQFGRVDIPQEAFISALKMDELTSPSRPPAHGNRNAAAFCRAVSARAMPIQSSAPHETSSAFRCNMPKANRQGSAPILPAIRGRKAMPLQIVGAGFGRTGTTSLALALDQLGLGPCYHMDEVLRDLDHKVAPWVAAAEGRPDWDATFAGYNATCDWPSCNYWQPILAHYPGARVILTTRSAESWYESFSQTIAKLVAEPEAQPPHMADWMAMLDRLLPSTSSAAATPTATTPSPSSTPTRPR